MRNDKTMLAKTKNDIDEKDVLKQALDNYSGKQFIISGFRQKLIKLKIDLYHVWIAVRCYKNPLDWIRSLQYLSKLYHKFLGSTSLNKRVFSDGKYYDSLYMPGYNSEIYEKFIVSKLDEYKPVDRGTTNRFFVVFMGITKKCDLQCEHCYEWDNLNQKEALTLNDLKNILRKLQNRGVSQIQFSGGEPLQRMDDLLKLLKYAKKDTEFWVATSGYKLNLENAIRLKEAGLTGAIISLDHFIPEKHNTFRGFKKAYYWVEEAVKNAKKCNLVTCLSLCITKEFISTDNLMAYMELAKKLGISFVQFFEPKAVGHYKNKDVFLHSEHVDLLEDFYLKMNFNPAYKTYPIITYHGYYQRRLRCYSSGYKSIYIDTNGEINACPFCHNKAGNVLDDKFDENLKMLQKKGCRVYRVNEI